MQTKANKTTRKQWQTRSEWALEMWHYLASSVKFRSQWNNISRLGRAPPLLGGELNLSPAYASMFSGGERLASVEATGEKFSEECRYSTWYGSDRLAVKRRVFCATISTVRSILSLVSVLSCLLFGREKARIDVFPQHSRARMTQREREREREKARKKESKECPTLALFLCSLAQWALHRAANSGNFSNFRTRAPLGVTVVIREEWQTAFQAVAFP